MTTARLIFTENCNRNCPKCCNKNFDFSEYRSWKWNMVENFDMLCITGGEPMLFPNEVIAFIKRFRALELQLANYTLWSEKTKLYLYTAYAQDLFKFRRVLALVDGITLTLHEQSDVPAFQKLNYELNMRGPYDKSLRLSVFNEITLPRQPFPLWNIMVGREWLDYCTVPEDEMLVMRYNFER